MFTNRQLGKLLLPLLIEQTLSIFVGMADTVMVSALGDAAISGVSLVDMFCNVLIALFSALATGEMCIRDRIQRALLLHIGAQAIVHDKALIAERTQCLGHLHALYLIAAVLKRPCLLYTSSSPAAVPSISS